MSNNNEQDSISVINGKYEYKRTPLEKNQSKYIYIPLSIILDNDLDARRIGIFSYLRIHCGLNDTVGFSVPDMVEWCGSKSDKRTNGTNDKFLSCMDMLNDSGYFTYLTERSRSSYMKCKFDIEYYYEECSSGYAVVYIDEIDKIMNYKTTHSSITNTSILLVFAYFRNRIRRRPNELKPEERSSDGIMKRRERCPDAYNANINDISYDIGISSKTVSRIIDILEEDLKLIVTDRAFRIKNENDEFRTLPTIFANAYKREDKYLLATGEEYSRAEIELKVQNINKYYNYVIDISKRRNLV